VPEFTIFGPAVPGLDMQFAGVAATTDSLNPASRETLLRLAERLAVRAPVAAGHVLRVLPPQAQEEVLPPFPSPLSEPLDGLIELRFGAGSQLRFEAEGDACFLGAVLAGKEILDRLGSEDCGGGAETESRLVLTENPWRLVIVLPRAWPAPVVVFWSSQFLLGFFRAHAESRSLATLI
jgi:hypothetical protein